MSFGSADDVSNCSLFNCSHCKTF